MSNVKQQSPGAGAAIVVAGGAGLRLGGEPKQFRAVGGRPMLEWSVARFSAHPGISRIVVVLPPERVDAPPAWLQDYRVILAGGGANRQDSVGAGLRALGPWDGPVLIHDAARPFISAELVNRLLEVGARGPVIPVLPVADAVKRVVLDEVEAGDRIDATLDRDRLRLAQTPQAFPGPLIGRLHHHAAAEDRGAPDDAALCEAEGIPVRGVPGEPWAFKVTRREDLAIADWLTETGRVRWPDPPGPTGDGSPSP